MGNNIVQVTDVQWGDMRDKVLKQEGWFVPTLLIKYAQTGSSKTVHLKELCSSWLRENFKISADIDDFEILNQEEIDRTLGLVGIKFTFSNASVVGESVVFLNAEEVENIV